jgi:hypothetical protein
MVRNSFGQVDPWLVGSSVMLDFSSGTPNAGDPSTAAPDDPFLRMVAAGQNSNLDKQLGAFVQQMEYWGDFNLTKLEQLTPGATVTVNAYGGPFKVPHIQKFLRNMQISVGEPAPYWTQGTYTATQTPYLFTLQPADTCLALVLLVGTGTAAPELVGMSWHMKSPGGQPSGCAWSAAPGKYTLTFAGNTTDPDNQHTNDWWYVQQGQMR